MVKHKPRVSVAHLKQDVRRAYAMGLSVGGVSKARVAHRTGTTVKTVRNTLARYKGKTSLCDRPRSGRPKEITTELKRRVRRMMLDDALGSKRRVAAALKQQRMKVGASTVLRIAKSMGLKCRVRGKKYRLSAEEKQLRLAFANKHKTDPETFVRSTIYLDEKLFVCCPKKRFVWIEDPQTFDRSAPATGEHWLYAIAAISWHGPIDIWYTTERKKASAAEFVDALETSILKRANALFGEEQFILAMDNDSVHNSADVRKYLKAAGVGRIEDWPPYSPDLNLIENVWGFMSSRMAGRPCTNARDFRAAVEHAWDSISDKDTECLFASVQKRYDAVIAAKGGPTRF